VTSIQRHAILIAQHFRFNRLIFQFICIKYQERKLIWQNAPSEKNHPNNDGSFGNESHCCYLFFVVRLSAYLQIIWKLIEYYET